MVRRAARYGVRPSLPGRPLKRGAPHVAPQPSGPLGVIALEIAGPRPPGGGPVRRRRPPLRVERLEGRAVPAGGPDSSFSGDGKLFTHGETGTATSAPA